MVERNNQFCCEELQAILEDVDAPIEYEPRTREYVLVVPKSYIKPPDTCRMAFGITCCPRCGITLPSSLVDEWYEIVEHNFGTLTWPINQKQLNRLPEEFRTDVWWKKRGL